MLQETHENNLKCRRVTFHALKSLSNAEESLFKTNICMEKVHQNKPHAIALRCFDIATKVLLYEIFLRRTAPEAMNSHWMFCNFTYFGTYAQNKFEANVKSRLKRYQIVRL